MWQTIEGLTVEAVCVFSHSPQFGFSYLCFSQNYVAPPSGATTLLHPQLSHNKSWSIDGKAALPFGGVVVRTVASQLEGRGFNLILGLGPFCCTPRPLPPVSVWVLSGLCSFLPLSKNMRLRTAGNWKLTAAHSVKGLLSCGPAINCWLVHCVILPQLKDSCDGLGSRKSSIKKSSIIVKVSIQLFWKFAQKWLGFFLRGGVNKRDSYFYSLFFFLQVSISPAG